MMLTKRKDHKHLLQGYRAISLRKGEGEKEREREREKERERGREKEREREGRRGGEREREITNLYVHFDNGLPYECSSKESPEWYQEMTTCYPSKVK